MIELNRRAAARITAKVELHIVPGATHLFAEPGALTAAATLARDWFTRHLVRSLSRTGPWWLSGGPTGPFR